MGTTEYNKKNYKQLKAEIKIEDYKLIDDFCFDNNIKKTQFVLNACKYFIDKNKLPPNIK